MSSPLTPNVSLRFRSLIAHERQGFSAQRSSRLQLFVVAAGSAFVALTLSGCGTFRGEGQVGPELHPQVGASVSFPLGK